MTGDGPKAVFADAAAGLAAGPSKGAATRKLRDPDARDEDAEDFDEDDSS